MSTLIKLIDNFQEAAEALAKGQGSHEEILAPLETDASAARGELLCYIRNSINAHFDVNSSLKKKATLLCLVAGIGDSDKLSHADDDALRTLLADIFCSRPYQKLIRYMRS